VAHKRLVCILALAICSFGAAARWSPSRLYAAPKTAVQVARLDPAANDIIPQNLTVDKLATGFTWTEGPVWIHDGYLLFAEITSNSIRKLRPGGSATIFLQPSGYKGSVPYGGPEPGSNGMTLDAHGRLTVAGHAQRDVYRFDSLTDTAHTTILADTYQGKRLNSPNDLVYKSDGSLYFTDPPYGLRTQADTDPAKELTVNGVYRIPAAIDQKAGAPPQRDKLQLVIKDLPRPNGIAFSPGEKFLYVSNGEPQKTWVRYEVKPDGTVGHGTVIGDATADKRIGGPDGIKVDRAGNLYGAGPGGVWIFSAAGKHIATIDMPDRVSNVNWGGADDKSLFVTGSNSVYRITLKIRGVYP
jgi:gluconolactonase